MNEFTSTYYDYNNDSLYIFKQYTASSVNNIYNPYPIEELKSNMENEYNEDKSEQGVVKPSLKR